MPDRKADALTEDRPMTDELQAEYELKFGTLGEGAEGEEDLPQPTLQGLSEAVVTGTDWTAETILRQLERGNIKLDPEFQRRDAWRAQRKSRFIESLIVGLPIPQLVLAEDKDRRGSYIVIDGKQRLLSLRQFAAREGDHNGYTPLRLQGLQLRADLNGKTLSDMERDPDCENELRNFQNQPIRTVVIKGWPEENILYLIFLRLNTASVQLSPQELRQALHPGPFVQYANERSGRMVGLQQIFKTSEPDFRMRDVELFVRYFAFRNFLPLYDGNLKDFLDLTCEKLNHAWDKGQTKIEREADDLESAMDATFAIFGEDGAFRKWEGAGYEGRFNRAVFDIMVFYFTNTAIRKHALASRRRTGVQADFKALCEENQEFLRSIETSTKSLQATANRLNVWGNSLKRRLRTALDIPTLQGNRIKL